MNLLIRYISIFLLISCIPTLGKAKEMDCILDQLTGRDIYGKTVYRKKDGFLSKLKRIFSPKEYDQARRIIEPLNFKSYREFKDNKITYRVLDREITNEEAIELINNIRGSISRFAGYLPENTVINITYGRGKNTSGFNKIVGDYKGFQTSKYELSLKEIAKEDTPITFVHEIGHQIYLKQLRHRLDSFKTDEELFKSSPLLDLLFDFEHNIKKFQRSESISRSIKTFGGDEKILEKTKQIELPFTLENLPKLISVKIREMMNKSKIRKIEDFAKRSLFIKPINELVADLFGKLNNQSVTRILNQKDKRAFGNEAKDFNYNFKEDEFYQGSLNSSDPHLQTKPFRDFIYHRLLKTKAYSDEEIFDLVVESTIPIIKIREEYGDFSTVSTEQLNGILIESLERILYQKQLSSAGISSAKKISIPASENLTNNFKLIQASSSSLKLTDGPYQFLLTRNGQVGLLSSDSTMGKQDIARHFKDYSINSDIIGGGKFVVKNGVIEKVDFIDDNSEISKKAIDLKFRNKTLKQN